MVRSRYLCKILVSWLLLLLLNPALTQIEAGDIAVIGINIGPDSGTASHNDEFAIVALVDLPGSTQVFLTDFGSDGATIKTGQAFDALEAIITWTTPVGGVDAGTVLVFSVPNATNNLSVSPNLGTFSVSGWTSTSSNGSPFNNGAGENIIVYTGTTTSPNYIYAFINSVTPGSPDSNEDWHTDAGSPQKSILPTGLLNSNGTNVATAHAMISGLHQDNMVYTGTYTGTKEEILTAIGNPSNWTTDDVNFVDLTVGGTRFTGTNPVFTITQPTPVIGTSTFDALGYATGPAFTVLDNQGTLSGGGAGLSASIANQSGWDIVAEATSASVTLKIQGDGSNGFGGSASLNVLISQMDYISFKSSDASAFDLKSFYYRAIAGLTTNNVDYTVTGYKSGSMVSGATVTGTITGNTLSLINIDGNDNFNDVDEFRLTAVNQGGSTKASNMRFDHITIGSAVTTPSSATVVAKVFLEGAYNGTDLNNAIQGSIPASQPYSGSIYNNHIGTENAAVPSGAVDWVLVELREAGSAASALNTTRVGSAAGFLMSNGSIKATDGSSNLSISLSGNSGADFYVVIYHRNHLPIMSATTVSASSDVYTIDFTSSSAATYQSTSALVSLSGGKFGMPAGDTNGDGLINTTDLSTWRGHNGAVFNYGSSGIADFNLDGVINAIDRNNFQQKNTSKSRQVPGTS
ncbi:MAG: hypothetical protein HEP71_11840 [Roseivirga sp.]|nr:hypothetical protein [Roseivirga sp.]